MGAVISETFLISFLSLSSTDGTLNWSHVMVYLFFTKYTCDEANEKISSVHGNNALLKKQCSMQLENLSDLQLVQM